MSSNAYESIFTRNARLAKITDVNPKIAKLFFAIINHVDQMARERHVLPSEIDFDFHASPDGRMILTKIIVK